jgi:Na+(H+)/acetate symporter ActP
MKEMSWTKVAGAVILALGLLRPQVALALSFAGQPFVQYGDGQSYALAVDQIIGPPTALTRGARFLSNQLPVRFRT